MSEPFIGQITLFSFNYAPLGWSICDGSEVLIAQQTALYSLIGPQFGGDGQKKFNLPDLRSRAMVGSGTMPGGVLHWANGTALGSDSVSVTLDQYPNHTHTIEHPAVLAAIAVPTATPPVAFGNYNPAVTAGISASSANTNFAAGAVSTVGQVPAAAHENRQPLLALNPCIALDGDYPMFS